ncbi:MAG: zinc-binding dehydrogenase, partial [Nitrospiraceae bacterium]|nr:zinc-binding dehydrogenase [Nitrospiraceae bacterium]
FGGSCGHCAFCRVGDVVHCAELQVPGSSYPGGWAESVTVPASALARIPDGMDFLDAAPMGCAGVTTFNAIRKANLAPGATVAVLGIGGLGHLAIQFAAKMGFYTIALARGGERAGLARSLGAHDFVDATAHPAGKALAALGGADLIVCTAQTTEPVSGLLAGLRPHGRLTLLGVDDGTITLPAALLVMHELSVGGVVTGNTRDIEETMGFALMAGVRPLVERMPLEAANEALARIEAGNVAFRIVLDVTGQR